MVENIFIICFLLSWKKKLIMLNCLVSLELLLKDKRSLTGGSGLPDVESVPHAWPLPCHLPSPHAPLLAEQQTDLPTDVLLKDTCSGSICDSDCDEEQLAQVTLEMIKYLRTHTLRKISPISIGTF